MTDAGHARAQSPQRMHSLAEWTGSLANEMVSGFWHHRQASGHPLKKMVVRMPGPSWIENRWTSHTIALRSARKARPLPLEPSR